jgi:hypothetical protein
MVSLVKERGFSLQCWGPKSRSQAHGIIFVVLRLGLYTLPDWPGICNPPVQPPQCWDYKWVPPGLTKMFFPFLFEFVFFLNLTLSLWILTPLMAPF